MEYNAPEDLAAFARAQLNSAGVGYGLYNVDATDVQQAELLNDAARAYRDIYFGDFRGEGYSLLMKNCGTWVESILRKNGLSMPKLVNLGVGTKARFGLASNVGVSISYRFDYLSDLFGSLAFVAR